MDVKKYWKFFMRSQKKGSKYMEKKGKELWILKKKNHLSLIFWMRKSSAGIEWGNSKLLMIFFKF